MSINRVLAFSSSRVGNKGYLQTAVPVIENFLIGPTLDIVFIPFAAVANDYEGYGEMVRSGLADLPHTINVAEPRSARQLISGADVILVGGGNTFKLLHDIYHLQLLDIIRDKVNKGTPYIGWSAGANITGPTICTTNDMPVIEPKSFNALGLLPFQINPHYTNQRLEGHNGETRDQRLQEFVQLNPGVPVVGLPEGTALKLEGALLTYIGDCPGVLFTGEDSKVSRREIAIGDDLSFLL